MTEGDGISYPSWTSDSRFIDYNDMSSSRYCKRIMVGETHPQEVTNLKGLRSRGTDLGEWSGLTPENSRLFVWDTSVQEIYALDVEWP